MGNIAMESSGGTIVIGDDAVNQAMKFGTNGQRTISIGNSEANSGLVVKAGSGNMAVIVDGGTYNLDAGGNIAMESSGGTIVIGDDAVNQAIKFGTNGQR